MFLGAAKNEGNIMKAGAEQEDVRREVGPREMNRIAIGQERLAASCSQKLAAVSPEAATS